MNKKKPLKKLCVWLLKDGEALPVVPGAKKMRTWRLGEELTARGHEVIWWTSTFAHLQKKKVADRDTDYVIAPRFTLRMLEAGSYKHNISFKRIWQHGRLGRRFYETALRMPKPDLIVCSYPTIDLAYQSTRFGKEHNIPVVVDIRDMWPDTFEDYFAKFLRPFVRTVCHFLFEKKVREIFNASRYVIGSSQDMLDFGSNRGGCLPGEKGLFYLSTSDKKEKKEICTPKIGGLKSRILDKLTIGFIGTFGETYDLETVCKAAVALQNHAARFYFVLAGDGKQKNKLQRLYGHLPNLEFLGWLDKKESDEFLSLVDIGLIPIKNFTIPNKFFDYTSHGIPVLSSAQGECEKLIDHLKLGASYKPHQQDKLIAALLSIAPKSQLDFYKKNARRCFDQLCNPKMVYKEMADLLEISL